MAHNIFFCIYQISQDFSYSEKLLSSNTRLDLHCMAKTWSKPHALRKKSNTLTREWAPKTPPPPRTVGKCLTLEWKILLLPFARAESLLLAVRSPLTLTMSQSQSKQEILLGHLLASGNCHGYRITRYHSLTMMTSNWTATVVQTNAPQKTKTVLKWIWKISCLPWVDVVPWNQFLRGLGTVPWRLGRCTTALATAWIAALAMIAPQRTWTLMAMTLPQSPQKEASRVLINRRFKRADESYRHERDLDMYVVSLTEQPKAPPTVAEAFAPVSSAVTMGWLFLRLLWKQREIRRFKA